MPTQGVLPATVRMVAPGGTTYMVSPHRPAQVNILAQTHGGQRQLQESRTPTATVIRTPQQTILVSSE